MRTAMIALVAVASLLWLPAAAPFAGAAPEHRAAIVVDVGDGAGVKTACVRFSEESITGKEALERADIDLQPVFRSFSGEGAAVCSLCGKGCPADDTCLTCGGNNYWAYHRSASGAGPFLPSNSGVSNTRVRDGSVEGWRWGNGGAPPFRSVASVCDGAAAPTSTSTSTSTPTPPSRPPATTSPAGVRPGPAAVATTSPDGEAVPPPMGDEVPEGEESAQPAEVRTATTLSKEAAVPGTDNGGGRGSLVGFAVAVLLIVGALIVARRRRLGSW